ncbi:Na+/H+ antiporter NhaD/arsenite permease-like protein [Pullulanibacillus pueri]|uniref:Membrane protein n=1 Tax=Pullulanibacillus pueri TaxID=1437324 RepID=A0A8J2ZY99_9BACL|nr:ArsB/NhaD family transporter [Pullulanibacillus pueri]MBM7683083.1 Na+/H+ antiporter NhaD/arsenite permease-like protein [Pullulanibacillus pueri]GGH84859.1 membrane protein [Pullulanibacillus pueri]
MQFTIAIVIFLITYAFIITEKLNRAVIALAGAALMIFFGILNIDQAFEHIEWGTITLLIGMMILVGVTNKTGVFQFTAVWAAKLVKGRPIRILIILSILTAIGSAFLDNVTTVLLMVPVTFSITRILGVNPVPFLISEVLFSNIGGTATLIGDPPNIMIGQQVEHLTFNAFILNLTPIIIVIGAVTMLLLYFFYRKQLVVDEEKQKKLMALNEKEFIKDPKLMTKSLVVLGLTILSFLLHALIHVDPAVIAVSGATLLMLIGVKSNEVDEALSAVEWETIFFFAGLFTLVGGLREIGVIKELAKLALELTGGNITVSTMLVLWVSGFASATIDNIPYVATMIPLIKDMAEGMGYAVDSPHINALWWALSLGACLGGNGTLIGASANVVVAGMAEREGHGFSYLDFLKIGAPITIVGLLLSTVYIYFRYLIFL